MTEPFFHEQMSRLVGLRFVPSDLTTHWEALQDLPTTVLADAVSRAGRTRVDFPTPVQLREDADLCRAGTQVDSPDQTTPLAAPYAITVPQTNTVVRVTREWRYYCEDCSDSGRVARWCGHPAQKKPWQSELPCERRGEHGTHEWMDRCPCAETNPALVRKRARQAQYAAQHSATRPR
jgi:hypothetical protein